MSAILVLFIATVLALIALLLWAVRPAAPRFKSPDELFEMLSGHRHYYRLPQILLALKEKDTEFLLERNQGDLAQRLRKERKAIALQFLNLLETEYGTLLEASRVLAAMAPNVPAVQQWQRLRMSALFRWNCIMLKLRLRTGLNPWRGFARVSDMASHLSYQLETITGRIAERAALGAEFPSLLQ